MLPRAGKPAPGCSSAVNLHECERQTIASCCSNATQAENIAPPRIRPPVGRLPAGRQLNGPAGCDDANVSWMPGATSSTLPFAGTVPRRRVDVIQVLAVTLFVGLVGAVLGLQSARSIDIAATFGAYGAGESRWFILVHAGLAGGVALTAAVLPRRFLWLPLGIGALATATAVIAVAFAGLEAWSISVGILTLSGAWVMGRLLLGLPWLRSSGLADSGLPALCAGLSVLGLLVFLLGLAGWIRSWTVGLVVVATGFFGLVLLAVRAVSERGQASRLVSTRFRAGALGLLGIQGAFAIVWAGAPEVQFDALQYKAWLAAHWAYEGRIDGQLLVENPLTTYLGLPQLIAVPGHTLEASGVGRYLQLLAGVLLVAYVWRLGSRVEPAVGAASAIVVATAPMVLWQTSTAYDDLFLGLLVVGAGAAALRFHDRAIPNEAAVGAVIGFLAATCVTGKLHLAAFAVGLPLAWCLTSRGLGGLWRRAAGAVAGLVVGATPLLAYRWELTGNPVFPFFNTIFESPYYQTGYGLADFSGGGTAAGTAAGGTVHWIWSLLTTIPPGIEFAAAGVLGLLVPVTFLALLFGWHGSPARRAVWGGFAIAVLTWWFHFRYLRFLLPYAILAVPVVQPLLGRLKLLVGGRVGSRLGLVGCAVAASAFLVSTFGTFSSIPDRWPLRVAVGAEADESYLRRSVAEAALFEDLNAFLPRNARIVSSIWGRSYARPDLLLLRDWEVLNRLELAGAYPASAADIFQRLRDDGIEWVVLADGDRLFGTSFLEPVVKSYGQIVFADHLRDVYRLSGMPSPRTPVNLCDQNVEKRECWFGAVPIDETPGLTDAEVRGEPIGQAVPVCGGATYALTVTTPHGVDPTRVYWVFDVEDTRQAYRFADAPAARTSVIHQTAPSDATYVHLIVDTLGPSAGLESMALEIVAQPRDGARCG